MPEETKKSYNPFKMWGSWVGMIIVSGWPLMGIIKKTAREGVFICITNISFGGSNSVQCGLFEFLVNLRTIFVYLFMILGFFVGWGIHSLF